MRIPFPGRSAALVTGDQIAADALKWRGQGYVFGGDASRPGLWDCSSFVSYVLGHDLRLGLPGGKWGAPGFPPNAHGPVVTDYASWRGALTVQSPARGDLVCFVGSGADGHIGFFVGPIIYKGQHYDQGMMSALDSVDGTLTTPVQGFGPPGAPIVYRRVLGAAAGSTVGAVTTAASGQQGTGPAVVAVLLLLGMVGAVLGGAVLAGAGLSAAGVWLAGKAARSA